MPVTPQQLEDLKNADLLDFNELLKDMSYVEVVETVVKGARPEIVEHHPGVDRFGNTDFSGPMIKTPAQAAEIKKENKIRSKMSQEQAHALYKEFLARFADSNTGADRQKLFVFKKYISDHYNNNTEFFKKAGKEIIIELVATITKQSTPEPERILKIQILANLMKEDFDSFKPTKQQVDQILEISPHSLLTILKNPPLILVETAMAKLEAKLEKEEKLTPEQDRALQAIREEHTSTINQMIVSLRAVLYAYQQAVSQNSENHKKGDKKITQLANDINNIKNVDDIKYLIKDNIKMGGLLSKGYHEDSLNILLISQITKESPLGYSLFRRIFPELPFHQRPNNDKDMEKIFSKMGLTDLPDRARRQKAEPAATPTMTTLPPLRPPTISSTWDNQPKYGSTGTLMAPQKHETRPTRPAERTPVTPAVNKKK